MAISKRIRLLADLVTEGYVIADIGTDHGYVPITLLRENKIPKAIAVDLSAGSLQKAVDNAERAGVKEKIDFRLSDGLSGLHPGEAECIIIAGMGGILMTNILQAQKEVALSARELILSPHRDAELVRECVRELGFQIVFDEEILDKKKYPVIKAVRK